jgi:FkbM family methyltransferase
MIPHILSWIGCRIGKPPGWERIVRWLQPPKSCTEIGEIFVVREGTGLITRPDIPLGWHITFFGTYEPEVREVFRAFLRPGGVVLDIGANIGWHTLLMAQLVGPTGRVIAVEANPHVCNNLRENIRLNRFEHVQILSIAIANSEGTAEFLAPLAEDASSGDGHVLPDQDRSGCAAIRVKTSSLDQIVCDLGLDRIDFIKIDVEGFEWAVLQGARSTIERHRPHIIFESDLNYMRRAQGEVSLISEFFRGYRYKLFALERNWAQSLAENWPASANVFAMPLANRPQSEDKGTG